jgi:hypothetical protein
MARKTKATLLQPVNKRIGGAVVVSDLHCGSSVGLWPEGFECSTGNSIHFGKNLHQRWLWDCWQDANEKAIAHFKGRSFVLIVNGDCIEGRHHGTTEIVVSKNIDHAAAATECLRKLSANAEKTYFTAGTECHVGDFEQVICSELQGVWCGDKGLIEINGTLLDVAHHMPTSARAYLEAGAMSISLGNARLNYARVGQRVPKVFLRGHRHTGGYYSDGHALFLVTPAWQLLTRYGHKVVGDSICRPGLAILDWDATPDGGLPSTQLLTYGPEETAAFRA